MGDMKNKEFDYEGAKKGMIDRYDLELIGTIEPTAKMKANKIQGHIKQGNKNTHTPTQCNTNNKEYKNKKKF